MAFSIIYVTHESEAEARRIAGALLEARLVACANIFPIQSMYWWQGAIESGDEWVSILKTADSHWHKVKASVEHLHPYTVPCIMRIEVSANLAYEQWIHQQLANSTA